MSGLEQVGDSGARSVAWFIHGILGRGRNFRSFARRLTTQFPSFRALLPDLRCHGEAPAADPPHDLDACVSDLSALARAHGHPSIVVGHSFGGKVAALWASRHADEGCALWVLDSPPSALDFRALAAGEGDDPARILEILRAAPARSESRERMRAYLQEALVPRPIADWLLTSAVERDGRWEWLWDLDGVQSMLQSYARTDLWPALLEMRDRRGGPEIHLVRAGRSGRYSPRDLDLLATFARPPRAATHLVPNAGHWLHVDAPDETSALLAESFAARS